MKVWKVVMTLNTNGCGTWSKCTKVISEEANYKLVDDKYVKIKSSWIQDTISAKIKVKQVAGVYYVECGYDHMLNDSELKSIEAEMIKVLKVYLDSQFRRQTDEYNSKLNGLFS